MKFIVTVVTSLLILYLTLIGMSFVGCASTSTKVEIDPGETAQIIIVEPKKKERWGWKMREYLRLERQKVEKEDKK